MTVPPTTDPREVARLYRARADRVDVVDVPELGYLVVGGHGSPGGAAFAAAFETLMPVVYAAHFVVRRQQEARRTAPDRLRTLIRQPVEAG
ncbi:hypothetical protein [Nocardioides panacisoli]|uniref:Uncharacterized protein n=1 Tax=Nocardioides panacisoli TaxID=627624 RepID=A0ABP7ISD6_9ACTN